MRCLVLWVSYKQNSSAFTWGIFTELASRPIQCISFNVRVLSSPPGNTASRWTGDLWLTRRRFYFWNVRIIFGVLIFFGFLGSVLVNQPSVHSGRVSNGRVCGCASWRRWKVTGDGWHMTPGTRHVPFLYECCYTHTLKNSVCRIFMTGFQIRDKIPIIFFLWFIGHCRKILSKFHLHLTDELIL